MLTLTSISSIHSFLNKMLPFRAGEASLPFLFKRHYSITYSEGIGALVFFRYLDLCSVILLLSISSFNIKTDTFNTITLGMTLMLIFIVLIVIWIKLNSFLELFSKLFRKVKGKKFERVRSKMIFYTENIIYFKKSLSYRRVFFIALSSIGAWLLTYLLFYSLVLSFSLDYSILEVIFASSIANFSMLIPISAMGSLGTFEAGWVLGFVLIGMKVDVALPIGLFANIFGMILLSFLALAGYIYLRVKYQNLKKL